MVGEYVSSCPQRRFELLALDRPLRGDKIHREAYDVPANHKHDREYMQQHQLDTYFQARLRPDVDASSQSSLESVGSPPIRPAYTLEEIGNDEREFVSRRALYGFDAWARAEGVRRAERRARRRARPAADEAVRRRERLAARLAKLMRFEALPGDQYRASARRMGAPLTPQTPHRYNERYFAIKKLTAERLRREPTPPPEAVSPQRRRDLEARLRSLLDLVQNDHTAAQVEATIERLEQEVASVRRPRPAADDAGPSSVRRRLNFAEDEFPVTAQELAAFAAMDAPDDAGPADAQGRRRALRETDDEFPVTSGELAAIAEMEAADEDAPGSPLLL